MDDIWLTVIGAGITIAVVAVVAWTAAASIAADDRRNRMADKQHRRNYLFPTSRRFELHRDEDPTGVAGTGLIAHGVQFPDGVVALRWTTTWPTSVVFHDRGIDAVKAVHGHGGKTRIVWLDPEDGPAFADDQGRPQTEEPPFDRDKEERAMAGMKRGWRNARRADRQDRGRPMSVQVNVAPAPPDPGFAAGVQRGYEEGLHRGRRGR